MRTTSTASTLPSPRSATGETRKRSTIRRGCPLGSRAANSRSRSTLRRARSRSCSSASALAASSSRSAGSTATSQPASSPSSCSSGGVNAAWTGPAPAEHHDLADPRVDDRPLGLVDRVGRRELLRGQREHPGAVDRDVPVPDDDGALAGEVEVEVLEVGVAVVPGDEGRRGPRARQVLARDPEAPVGLGADRVDDGVVALEQLVVRDRAAHVDVAEEAEARPRRRLLERARDRLDVLVIRGDAEPDEAPGRRQPVEQVDRDRRVVALEQRVGRVEARPGPSRRRRREGALTRASVSPEARLVTAGRRLRRPTAPRRRPPGSSSRSRTTTPRSGCRS